jgi:hypothetical protein
MTIARRAPRLVLAVLLLAAIATARLIDPSDAKPQSDPECCIEAILNSWAPINGTTVLSSPTMPPTKALIRTRSENCRQFSRKPSRTSEAVAPEDLVGKVILFAARAARPRRAR